MIRDIVLMKLHAVGLRGARDLMPSQVSGGMARRVALARAIALDPELIMYDEPFAGLDPISLGTAARLIRTLNDALGLTSILVSHDLEETFHVADHVVILGAGGIAAQGSPEEVRANPDPLVQQFIHARPNGPVPFHYPAPAWSKTLEARHEGIGCNWFLDALPAGRAGAGDATVRPPAGHAACHAGTPAPAE